MLPVAAIRPASPADAAPICAIYNQYVTTTTISFEEEPVSQDEMARRIADVHDAGLPWLVLVLDGQVCGYAYTTKWRARAAYRHSVESSVYLAPELRGQGWGARLYRHLIDALRTRGLRTVIAGIAQPNERSIALHERLGFRKVAHFAEVGFKFGQWVDVAYWQMQLDDTPAN